MEYVNLAELTSIEDVKTLATNLAFEYANSNEEYTRYYRRAYESIKTAWLAYQELKQEVEND